MSLKYRLYENAVQTPSVHAQWFDDLYWSINRKHPSRLREDFCGTFAISTAWVKRDPRNRALGLDLDPEPIAFGMKAHRARLGPSVRRRLVIRRQNVISVTRPGVDLVVACNFSINIIKREDELARYLAAARRSLAPQGLFVAEIAGGPGMMEQTKEWKIARKPNGKRWYTYVWDQQAFDPITHEARYAIHFNVAGGESMRNAFVYDWRLWTIPELRYALRRAGFRATAVYWEEADEDAKGSGVFTPREQGDNDYSWVAYVVGIR